MQTSKLTDLFSSTQWTCEPNAMLLYKTSMNSTMVHLQQS